MSREDIKRAEVLINKALEKRMLPTTTQLRKIFSQINNLKNTYEMEKLNGNIVDGKLSDKILDDLEYLKMQVAYQCGRAKKERGNNLSRFIVDLKHYNSKGKQLNFLEYLSIIKTVEDMNKFFDYAEALIAYQKFYGRDK
ncbi:type III-A CRISPR-associated protein Csm2 [Anaerofustis butyriciformans]|uniref:type III-A CRISPR-associated protein Csm2 n=1 Tax=Anaerofustis butyriciformans TaxID=3108533 RepID=UPI002E319BC1|nr:type III-A CRISPR-associated protein Csm2 [Anaerofustis sp. HA2171]